MFHQYSHLSFFFVFFVIIPTVNSCNERRVVDALFENYSKLVRPVLQQNQTLNIQYELRVYNIISVDEPEEIIKLLLWSTVRWFDPSLSWNPQDFDGCTGVKVPAELVWLPDVYFVNAVEIETISPTGNDVVRITEDGIVRLALKCKVEMTCKMEIDSFPFDTQDCPIIIGLWSYNYSEAVLQLRYPIVGLAPYNGDPEYAPVMGNISEFEIVAYTGYEVMTTRGHKFSELHYSIGLNRRPAYYIFVILIPSYLLTSLCIIGIFTPNSNMNERNERVTLGLTTLLSMAVILDIVANLMPKGREGLALLGIFVLYEIGICTLAIILSTVIIICHQRANMRYWKPPALCLWIGRVRILKNDCEVSSKIVKRDSIRYYERGSPDDSINYIIDNNFERLATNVRSVCSTLRDATESMEKRIQEEEERENQVLIWQNFFDTLDLFLLVLLLFLNTLISYVVLF